MKNFTPPILALILSFLPCFLLSQNIGFFQNVSAGTLNFTTSELQKVQELDALTYVKEITFAEFGNLSQTEQNGLLSFKVPGDTNT